ncbi:hypothetical protein D3C80_2039780 [compost metagenome]
MLLKQLGSPPGTLEALRRRPQALDSAEARRLRLTEIVAVEIGRRVGDQQVQLDEAGHGVNSLLVSGSSAAACSRLLR